MPSISWLASRCLEAPPHPLACDRCQAACPAHALAFIEDATSTNGGPRLLASDACHGCAQCIAACPTEALISHDFETLTNAVKAHDRDQPLSLACHRVASEDVDHQRHCLRALGSDSLTWLKARVAPTELILRLPEGCADCPAKPDTANQPDAWLDEACRAARLVSAEAGAFAPAMTPSVSRRRFLLGQPAATLPSIPADDAAPRARRLQRRITAAQTLHEPVAIPSLSLNVSACQAHGVCVRVCPTPALQESDTGELRFAPLACLDCGHCLSACPEGALEMASSTDTTPRTLRESRTAHCFDCGRSFTPEPQAIRQPSPRCPACRRDKALLQESFHDLFG
ncbi:4Fe-4S dicluster domain-containing protein [Halomonas faecis]|uniref:4Fe-4S dicluster domain-containing protein n=1 Tax=Halomonas faecis TaxID=1562110 RepID=UPI0013D497F7|nr:4Fe-4S dicluster domain-containing protein [Halomonas faecis]